MEKKLNKIAEDIAVDLLHSVTLHKWVKIDATTDSGIKSTAFDDQENEVNCDLFTGQVGDILILPSILVNVLGADMGNGSQFVPEKSCFTEIIVKRSPLVVVCVFYQPTNSGYTIKIRMADDVDSKKAQKVESLTHVNKVDVTCPDCHNTQEHHASSWGVNGKYPFMVDMRYGFTCHICNKSIEFMLPQFIPLNDKDKESRLLCIKDDSLIYDENNNLSIQGRTVEVREINNEGGDPFFRALVDGCQGDGLTYKQAVKRALSIAINKKGTYHGKKIK